MKRQKLMYIVIVEVESDLPLPEEGIEIVPISTDDGVKIIRSISELKEAK